MSLIDWLGKFHPVVVHFPVALLIAAAVAEGAAFATGRAWFSDAARFCIWGGAAGGVVAVPLGWFNAGWDFGRDAWILGVHRWGGTAVLLWSVVSVALGEHLRRRGPTASRRAYRIVLIVGAVGVAVVGHFGGILVFGRDYYAW